MPRQHLTPNACLVCRKKRTKCDGQLPCRRCRSRGEECSYEDKKWRTKDHLRSEIERLRTEQRQGNALLRALTNNDPDRWDMALDRMRAGDHPDNIAEWILAQSSRTLPTASNPSSRICPNDEILSRHMLSPLRVVTASGPTLSPPRPPQAGPVIAPGVRGLDLEEAVKLRNNSLPEQTAASVAGPSRGSFSSIPSPTAARFSCGEVPWYRPQPLFALSTVGLPNLSLSTPRRQHLLPPEALGDPIPHTWTRVTNDTQFVQRLLAKFFSSSLAYLSLVPQRHFMQDFREGTPRYCSEALVNAILGMACNIATTTSRLVSRISFGDAFLGEAKALLAKEHDHTNLPSIQALAILALAEMTQGNEEEASDLSRASARTSIRFLLQTQHGDTSQADDFNMVRAVTYCGCLTLLRHLRLLTGDLDPKTGPLFMRLFPDSRDAGDDAPDVRVERGISMQRQFFSQLKFCPPLARFIYEVTEAAHTFSSYNYSQAMTAGDLDTAFNKCTAAHRQAVESGAFEKEAGHDVLLAQTWYNFCLLGLLQPFVTNSARLVDGLPPSLSGEATPDIICQNASGTIISLTSTYQAQYSLEYLPPLLPYMVFAALLYQLSMTIRPLPQPNQQQQGLVESPEPLSPRTTTAPSYTLSSARPGISRTGTGKGSIPSMTEPSSPSLFMQTPRTTRRKTSVFSTASTCFSNDDQLQRPSICSFTSSSTSDNDEPSFTPDTGSDGLPTFTSRPADLVTIGTLQLASMGAQHPGAAEAAQLLRRVSMEKESSMGQPKVEPAPFLQPVPAQANLFDGAPPPAGSIGLQMIPGYEPALVDMTPVPSQARRQSGFDIPLQPTAPPPPLPLFAGAGE